MSTFQCTVDNLPNSIVNQFSAVDWRVARYHCKIFNKAKEVITLDKATIRPALCTIAKAVGATIWSVSRSLNKLYSLDVFGITRRRKDDGTYTINSYYLGGVFRAMLFAYRQTKKINKNLHLRKNATVLTSIDDKDNCFEDLGYIVDVGRGKRTVEEVLGMH